MVKKWLCLTVTPLLSVAVVALLNDKWYISRATNISLFLSKGYRRHWTNDDIDHFYLFYNVTANAASVFFFERKCQSNRFLTMGHGSKVYPVNFFWDLQCRFWVKIWSWYSNSATIINAFIVCIQFLRNYYLSSNRFFPVGIGFAIIKECKTHFGFNIYCM